MARNILAFIVLIAIACGFLFYRTYWVPAVYSVHEEDFASHGSYLLLQEVFYTGTGWVVIGDETGRFEPGSIKDVVLTGEKLPFSNMGQRVNTFLCIVEHESTVNHVAFNQPIDSYRIIEWYPVFPVVRDSLWPDWMLPSEFMTARDVKFY